MPKRKRDWMNPSDREIRFDNFRKHFLRGGYYRKYAHTFKLEGTEKVLEFGSGSGALSRHLARRLRHGGKLTLVDISPAWMEIARQKLARFEDVEFIAGDIRNLDIPNASFDAVVIHYMLHDIATGFRPGYVEAVAEKLKFGGALYIREPVKESHGMPPAEIRRLMTDHGLKEIDSVLDGKSYTGVFAK